MGGGDHAKQVGHCPWTSSKGQGDKTMLEGLREREGVKQSSL